LKARVSVYGGASRAGASVETDREHLPEVLRLVGEILRQPSFPQDEFDKLKQESLAGLEQQKTDPGWLANNMFERISHPPYPSDDPRYTRTFAEEVAAIESTTLDQLKEFYKAFYGASNATAGSRRVTSIRGASRRCLAKHSADWKSPRDLSGLPKITNRLHLAPKPSVRRTRPTLFMSRDMALPCATMIRIIRRLPSADT
jgi:hypothetical protein